MRIHNDIRKISNKFIDSIRLEGYDMAKYKLLLMLLLVSSSLFVAGCIDEDLSAEQIAEKMQCSHVYDNYE